MEKLQGENIGILGGSFDPVHQGHVRLGLEAQQEFQLDRILFVPAHQSPHKQFGLCLLNGIENGAKEVTRSNHLLATTR